MVSPTFFEYEINKDAAQVIVVPGHPLGAAACDT
jgi:hypothetical protein